MTRWTPSAQYRTVAAANRAFYAKTAHRYDTTECCVVGARLQQLLEVDLDRIAGNLLSKPPRAVQALDACGGSGNVAHKLSTRGMRVTICDLSPHLLDVFRLKHGSDVARVEIVCAEIGEYLASTKSSFDLIVFSSALHHLEDIHGVLALAVERLNPGGLLFTIFDPTSRRDSLTRALHWLDYVAFKIHRHPRDIPAAMLRNLRRRVRSRGRRNGSNGSNLTITNDNVGLLAEYHVARGIDDIALVHWLQGMGCEVVWHDRYPDARYGAIRSLLRLLNKATEFKLLLRKPLLEAR